ncbi:proline-rich protein 2-like [Balaenoptera ricei]|uniref:proline-rich protein 2-like n=1 Tax=Balaenoptera ricei TaxID=2746895 RepID=UPI0028BEC95D|nr:proline-rich protein 2-like [Balaenoptera ricei]
MGTQITGERTPRPPGETRGRPKDSGPPPASRDPPLQVHPLRTSPRLPFQSRGKRGPPEAAGAANRQSPPPREPLRSPPPRDPLEGFPQPSPRGRPPSPPGGPAGRPRLLSPQDYLAARSRLCASLPPSPRPPGLQPPRDPPPPPLKRRTAPEGRAEGEGAGPATVTGRRLALWRDWPSAHRASPGPAPKAPPLGPQAPPGSTPTGRPLAAPERSWPRPSESQDVPGPASSRPRPARPLAPSRAPPKLWQLRLAASPEGRRSKRPRRKPDYKREEGSLGDAALPNLSEPPPPSSRGRDTAFRVSFSRPHRLLGLQREATAKVPPPHAPRRRGLGILSTVAFGGASFPCSPPLRGRARALSMSSTCICRGFPPRRWPLALRPYES